MVERQLILKAATILTISTDQFIPFQYSKKESQWQMFREHWPVGKLMNNEQVLRGGTRETLRVFNF